MRPRATALLLVALALPAAPARAQEVEARLDRRQVAVGETTTLRVVVRGASGARTPEFDVPAGLQTLGSGRQQSFSWVNGRASVETEFRFEILAQSPGRYAIGPILVTVGSRSFRSGQLQLDVANAPPATGGRSAAEPAALLVDVDPADPWVGQEVTLRVRLLQRETFAEDPQYTPPSTTGFWTDRPSAPESYYAEERGQRVLVTETRARLYPLAVGETTIGEATATVALAGGSRDPLGWFGGLDRREVTLRSRPVTVRVRPLPASAPAGFGGAVGTFDVAWSADRARTSRDVPVTLRLDVRGRGNLPLIRPPAFASADVEVFASTVEDSLGGPGGGGGRKRFQWTLLPRHEGRDMLPAPAFAWFDPATASYRRADLPAVALEVQPAWFAGPGVESGFPSALAERPSEPGARPADPWAFALAGFALGGAARLWRRGGRRRFGTADGESADAWIARVRGTHSDEFWKVAEEAGRWLESHGKVADTPEWRDVRGRVAAARYGGGEGDHEHVRRVLVDRLGAAAPAPATGAPVRVVAAALAVAALVLCVAFGPRPGDLRLAHGAQAADQTARRGDIERARRAWLELWRNDGTDARLAARLAWSHVQAGEIGPAALWVLRGELADPREPAVEWVAERVREAGGLVGASRPRLPVRRLEWGIAGLLLGAAAMLVMTRRAAAMACAALAIAAAAVVPLESWLAARTGRAVVLERAALEGSDIELEPGQMVTVRGREGTRVRVAAGRAVEGRVPVGVVAEVVPPGGVDE